MFPTIVPRSYERVLFFRIYLLVFLWLFGLITGVCFAITTSADAIQFLGDVIKRMPSLVGLIVVSCVPLVLCAVGILTDFFPICCSTVVLTSVCRGYCGFLLYIFCGSGAWVLRAIFMFSSMMGAILLWWMLFRYCAYGKSNIRKDAYILTIFLFLLIMVDRLLVSPFLIRLSMYF